MVGKADPISKFSFPDVWREICDHHKDDWEIRLRPAANLIGYFLFPVGWHWTEFKALSNADKKPYESLAREASNFEFPLKRSLRKPATARRKTARKYRKAQVTGHLHKILMRSDVRYFHGPMRNIAAPNRDARPVERTLTSEDFADVRIEHSTVGRMISRQIDIKIDANDLIKHLKGEFETRGTKATYDLRKVERWCRDQLERNTPTLSSTTNLKATLLDAACDWHAEVASKSAGPDQVRPLVNNLLLEYLGEE